MFQVDISHQAAEDLLEIKFYIEKKLASKIICIFTYCCRLYCYCVSRKHCAIFAKNFSCAGKSGNAFALGLSVFLHSRNVFADSIYHQQL